MDPAVAASQLDPRAVQDEETTTLVHDLFLEFLMTFRVPGAARNFYEERVEEEIKHGAESLRVDYSHLRNHDAPLAQLVHSEYYRYILSLCVLWLIFF